MLISGTSDNCLESVSQCSKEISARLGEQAVKLFERNLGLQGKAGQVMVIDFFSKVGFFVDWNKVKGRNFAGGECNLR
jgi:hypothetical protein